MNASSPTPPARPRSDRRLWWIVPVAITAGLLLFFAIWSIERKKSFYTVEPGTEAANDGQVQVFEPLPTPMGGSLEDGLPPIADAGGDAALPPPAIIEPPRPAPPPPSQAPAPRPAIPAPRVVGGNAPPVPVSQPAPAYPRSALRSGIGGTVNVSVDVGPDGVPTSVSIASGSGSRDLDRAALDAVRRWRFRPATVGGQPSVGRVTVPIRFTPI